MFSSPSSSCLRLRRKSGNGQLIIYTLSLSLSSLDSSTRLHLGHLILSERESQPWAFAALLFEPGTVLPCLSDPVRSSKFEVRRSSLFLKLALVALHLVFIGFLLVCDAQFVEKTRLHPWYVIDAMRDVDETNAILYRYAPTTSFKNCLRCQKMVLDLYPPGTSLRNLTCGYCHVEQVNLPMWYICEESALCIWTLIMYIDYLTNVAKPWWKNAVIILLLVVLVISLIFVLLLLLFHRSNLILTNQSTYELVRRKRIPYMRNMPERVHPFSRGIKRNLYNVCCGFDQ
uniref:Uncharacterized protein n=1 Tax=Brassica oleracea var. oleracea TaxID=109376 RepID=A0A0D3A8C6_BRAOL